MSPIPSPPGETSTIHARRALVVAPHYDDEVLGCGGLIAQLSRAGTEVRVLFLSDGRGGIEAVDDRAAYGERRRTEARQAATLLGLAGIDELGLPDGELDQHLEALEDGIHRALLAGPSSPDLLLVTSPLEASRDHRAAFLAVHRVLSALRGGQGEELQILAYEVNHPLYPDLLVDVSQEIDLLRRAMGCYRSQQERHDYLEARLGLLRFRTLSLHPGIEAVEAYRRLSLQDFVTRGPAHLVRELGGAAELVPLGEGPLLSVVVRTRDRPQLLAEALSSLAASTYRRAEVVVVNDGGTTPALPADHPLALRLVELASNQGRAAAANAGIRAAAGDFITFLDDDDLVEPEHLATLAGLARAAGVRVAYTDAAVGIYELDGESGWHCRERRLPYSRDFDPDLLLVDNYIPFNTLVMAREVLSEVGELDVELPFFEDWDLLVRLAARVPFQHLARVTCEYRHFHGAGHHVLGDRPRERSDFLAMKARVLAKHQERLTPELVGRVVDRLRAEAVAAEETAAGQIARRREFEARFHATNGELVSERQHRQVLAASLESAGAEIERERQGIRERERQVFELEQRLSVLGEEIQQRDDELERLYARERELVAHADAQSQDLRATYAEIERLGGLIRAMESTRAWQLHQWWQKRRR